MFEAVVILAFVFVRFDRRAMVHNEKHDQNGRGRHQTPTRKIRAGYCNYG